MSLLRYKISATMRIVNITLAVIGLAIVLIEGYTQNDFQPTRFILLGLFGWYLLNFLIARPEVPAEPAANDHSTNTEIQA
jgi:hypothetical protein